MEPGESRSVFAESKDLPQINTERATAFLRDLAITATLAPFLERSGFSLAVAADGEDALHQVSSFGPTLIVLDVLMPKMDGREVLRRLREQDDWTPVLLLTPTSPH